MILFLRSTSSPSPDSNNGNVVLAAVLGGVALVAVLGILILIFFGCQRRRQLARVQKDLGINVVQHREVTGGPETARAILRRSWLVKQPFAPIFSHSSPHPVPPVPLIPPSAKFDESKNGRSPVYFVKRQISQHPLNGSDGEKDVTNELTRWASTSKSGDIDIDTFLPGNLILPNAKALPEFELGDTHNSVDSSPHLRTILPARPAPTPPLDIRKRQKVPSFAPVMASLPEFPDPRVTLNGRNPAQNVHWITGGNSDPQLRRDRQSTSESTAGTFGPVRDSFLELENPYSRPVSSAELARLVNSPGGISSYVTTDRTHDKGILPLRASTLPPNTHMDAPSERSDLDKKGLRIRSTSADSLMPPPSSLRELPPLHLPDLPVQSPISSVSTFITFASPPTSTINSPSAIRHPPPQTAAPHEVPRQSEPPRFTLPNGLSTRPRQQSLGTQTPLAQRSPDFQPSPLPVPPIRIKIKPRPRRRLSSLAAGAPDLTLPSLTPFHVDMSFLTDVATEMPNAPAVPTSENVIPRVNRQRTNMPY